MSANRSTERVDAEIGGFKFPKEFADPVVDVNRSVRTAEHELVGGTEKEETFVTQVLGRDPDAITITGVVYDTSLDELDNVGTNGSEYVRTERWSGLAQATSVETNFRREKDTRTNRWLYDVIIELIEVKKGSYKEVGVNTAQSTAETNTDYNKVYEALVDNTSNTEQTDIIPQSKIKGD